MPSTSGWFACVGRSTGPLGGRGGGTGGETGRGAGRGTAMGLTGVRCLCKLRLNPEPLIPESEEAPVPVHSSSVSSSLSCPLANCARPLYGGSRGCLVPDDCVLLKSCEEERAGLVGVAAEGVVVEELACCARDVIMTFMTSKSLNACCPVKKKCPSPVSAILCIEREHIDKLLHNSTLVRQ